MRVFANTLGSHLKLAYYSFPKQKIRILKSVKLKPQDVSHEVLFTAIDVKYSFTEQINAIKNCQVLVKNLNFVAGMTRRFVSAKRLIRYFSNSSKLVEHRAGIRKVSDESLGRDETPRHTSHEI